MKIEITTIPDSKDLDFLTDKINAESPQLAPAYNFAIFIRNEENEIIAGCNGSVIFGEIYTDQLWVHSNHRMNGLGKILMEKVHSYGRENSCAIATVATMSFQNAKGFYEKLGYVVELKRPGYINSSSAIYLKKIL